MAHDPSVKQTAAPRALTSVNDLITQGLAPPQDRKVLQQVEDQFRIRLSATVAQNDHPQVAAQFLPQEAELHILDAELADPIGDDAFRPVHGITHRYPDRVILHATQTCEVYCRFCFRREAVGENGTLSDEEFEKVVNYLKDHPQIWEVIFTGGDPLILSPRRLGRMLDQLEQIPSLQVIRFHSRIPVVAPEKITPELLATLDRKQAVWVVVHTNHPAEITDEAATAFKNLVRAGIPLLSQSVLLKGINADPETLEALFRKLIAHRVKPYYLHHSDLAKGTSHFRLSISEGQAIMTALRGKLSGTCLPLYILDIPGGYGKVPIGPQYVQPDPNGGWIVTDPNGQAHSYQDL